MRAFAKAMQLVEDMWSSLEDPDTISNLRRGLEHLPQVMAVADVLTQLATRPEAKGLFVATSLTNVALTTAPTWKDRENHRFLGIAADEQLAYALSLRTRSDEQAIHYHAVNVDSCIRAVIGMLPRLRADANTKVPSGPQNPGEDSAQTPKIQLGTEVRVVLNRRNRTARIGTVARSVFHHKHGCWVYFLENDGKAIKKRYFGADLETVNAALKS